MFNRKEVSTEIALAMEEKLLANAAAEMEQPIEKFARAIEYLNTAAEMFDDLGLKQEAEYTTTLLEVVAGKKKKKKPAKKKSKPTNQKTDPATEGLTPEKMMHNLKHKGWVFNADDEPKHSHGCMCSMCMDVNDVRHGDDCICSHCMDANDTNDVDVDDNYADLFGDFEDEVPLEKARRHVILPPKGEKHQSIHPKRPYDHTGISNWDYINDPDGADHFGR